jgi:arylsulfatase A-like enzyme
VISGPGVPVGESRDQLAYLFDLTATCLQSAGVDAGSEVHGQSLWPVLRNQGEGRDELLFLYAKTQRALRVGDHKLIRLPQIDRTLLFNVKTDPDELHDLAKLPEMKELHDQLCDRMRSLQAECDDPLAWTAKKQLPVEIDLTGKRWPADRWQPQWIRKKYW